MTDASKPVAPVPPRAPAGKTATGTVPRPAAAVTSTVPPAAPTSPTPATGVAVAETRLPSPATVAGGDASHDAHTRFITELDDAACAARDRAKAVAERCSALPTDRDDLARRLAEAEALARRLKDDVDAVEEDLGRERAAHAATQAKLTTSDATLVRYQDALSRQHRLLGEISDKLAAAETALSRAEPRRS